MTTMRQAIQRALRRAPLTEDQEVQQGIRCPNCWDIYCTCVLEDMEEESEDDEEN